MRRFLAIYIVFGLFLNSSFAQEKLFSIDDTDFYTKDFIEILKTSRQQEINDIADISTDDFNKYLAYCLKIYDGKKSKIYESKKFKQEFERSKKAILTNYIVSTHITKETTDKYYDRSMLLLDFQELAISPVNEITKRKIEEIKEKLDTGEDFTHLILQFGNKNLHSRKGITKNFKLYRRETAFEDAVFGLEVGEVSAPIKTTKAYHLVKLLKIHPNPGKVRIAHILVKNRRTNAHLAKQKIDSIYDVVIADKKSFGKIASSVSEDIHSARYGGLLPGFGKGDYIPAIEEVAFKLPKKGDISEAIKTVLGWHIIQLIAYNSEYYSKNEIRFKLADNFLNDINLQKKQTNFKEYEGFSPGFLASYTKNDFDKKIFRISGQDYTIKDFHLFNEKKRFRGGVVAYNQFVKETLYEQFVQSILNNAPAIQSKINEAYESHIFFYIQNNKIWEKTFFQSAEYFRKNKAFYQQKYGKDVKYEDISKEVSQDYTEAINREWIAELKAKYSIKIYPKKFKNSKILVND